MNKENCVYLKQKEKVKKLNMQYRQEIKEEPIYS